MMPKRQLVAILFADVEGFTALVQQDENRAKIIKDKFHNVVETDFKNHHGRIIHFQGDGVCCIFFARSARLRHIEDLVIGLWEWARSS